MVENNLTNTQGLPVQQQENAVNPNIRGNDDQHHDNSTMRHPYFSFADIETRDLWGAILVRQHTVPRIVGGKIAITINEEEYSKSLQ